ncbi:MAG: YbhB/YbcL family Raf kinase inhibitor-like protein, partial [Candidatus Nanohalobium sp.]
AETTEIGEGEKPIGAEEGKNDFGDRKYGGPNPPDTEHTYRFKLYALDTELELENTAKKEDLEEAMEGHVVEKASLKGTYEPL